MTRRQPVVEALEGALLACAAGALLLRLRGDAFAWTIWSDRDLVLAWRATLGDWVPYGAELSYGDGARIPGGLPTLALGALVRITDDPLALFRVATALDGVALAAVYAGLRRVLGGLPAAAAIATMATAAVGGDALVRLWNPSWLALPCAIAWMAAVTVVDTRSGRWLPAVGLALALAAQAHLSAALLGATLAAAIAAARPVITARQAGATAVAVLLPYLPYAVVEAATGWPNTRLFGEQPALKEGASTALANLPGVLGWLAGTRPGATAPDPWLLGWPVLAAAAAWIAGDARTRRLVLLPAVALAGMAIAYATDGQIDLHETMSGRYTLAWLPGVGVLAAACVAAVGARWPRAAGTAALALVVVQGLGLRSALVAKARADDAHRTLVPALLAARDALGVDASTAARCTTVVRRTGPDAWRRDLPDAMTWFGDRAVDGPTATCPACAVVVLGVGGPADAQVDVSPETLARLLDAPPGFAVDEVRRLPTGDVVARTRQEGPCYATTTNRYLRSEAERALWAHATAWPEGEVRPLPSPGWRRGLWWTPPGQSERMVIAVEAQPDDGGVRWVVDSPQLRGRSYNGGPFHDLTVQDLTLHLGDQEVRVAPAAGTLGAPAPITVGTPAPLGPVMVQLSLVVAGEAVTLELGAYAPP